MTLDEFRSGFRVLEDYVKTTAEKVLSRLDRITFGMLVDCLKKDDPEAVREAIDQLAQEKRPVAIPPLYLVSVAHPNAWVRQRAQEGLKRLAPEEEVSALTKGKDIRDSVEALIERYGHYRG